MFSADDLAPKYNLAFLGFVKVRVPNSVSLCLISIRT